jgi:hypothetical protein
VRPQNPELVASQYTTETPLEARRSIYTAVEGPDAREVAFTAFADIAPERVLEVGGGLGERFRREEAAELLERLVVSVERQDVDAWVTVDPDGVQRWVESLGGRSRPKLVGAPVRARIACAILVARA